MKQKLAGWLRNRADALDSPGPPWPGEFVEFTWTPLSANAADPDRTSEYGVEVKVQGITYRGQVYPSLAETVTR